MVRPRVLGAVVVLLAACAAAATPSILGDQLEKQLPCHKRSMRKATLKLLKETAFAGLFPDLKNSTEFEASGMSYVRGKMYAVFDNSMAIGVLDDHFHFRDPDSFLVGPWEPESQFEGISYVPENDTFLLLVEAAHKGEDVYKPEVIEVKLKPDNSGYDIIAHCDIDFEISHSNKGFESIQYIHTPDGPFLLGLCEGNHCQGGEEGRDKGNGRIIVSELQWQKDGVCVWEPVKTIHVPASAYFLDYAAMAYNYETEKLAILSQEESEIWVGDFHGDSLDFKSQEGQIVYLPRNEHCEMIYCNGEGLQWIDHYRIVVASDRAKATQPYWCDAKDQSVHLFAMPRTWDPHSPADVQARAAREEEAAEEAGLSAEL